MPTAQHNPQAVNARRFAALLAGFDTGNACDEEALSKGRALRRIAAEAHSRIVDLLEMPEIKQAIDDQMQPARKDSRELQAAMEQLAAMREELTQRTRDVRRFTEMLTQEKEANAALRNRLAAWTRTGNHPPTPTSQSVQSPSPTGSPSRGVSISKSDFWMLIKLFLLAVALFSIAASIAQCSN